MPLEIYPPFLGPASTSEGDSVSLTTFISDTLWLLRESTDSTAAAIDSGTGTISTTSTVKMPDLVNEAMDWLCRTCLYLPCLGADAAVPSGTNYVNIKDLEVDTDGLRELWAARAVGWNNAQIVYASESALRRYDPGFEFTTAGTPTNWFRSQSGQIGLYPKPSADGALAVYGLGYALRLGDGTGDTVTSTQVAASANLRYMVPRYCAVMIAKRNWQDASLMERVGLWEAELVEEATRLWLRLDPDLRLPGGLYGTPPRLPEK